MTRIAPSATFAEIPVVDLGQGDRINLGVVAIVGRLGKVAEGLGALNAALRSTETLPPRLLELVRLRIAFHNQCRSCMAIRYAPATEAGVDEALVCSLERPQEADDLTDGERAALAYADLFANNHLAIDEATYDGLREHFTEPEIVGIGMVCGLCVGFGRLESSWDMVDELPERFSRRGVTITPWGEGDLVRA